MAEAAETKRESRDDDLLRIAMIARGGIGTVELVMREKGGFSRLYALKRLHEHLRDDPEIRRMFEEEARVAGLLRHRNVVSVLDVGEDDGGSYLLMDFVDGLPLSRVVVETRQAGDLLPVSICLRIARDVAAGLSAAHELVGEDGRALKLVHRDISPQNILVAFDGTVKVTDFGIAKAVGGDGNTTTHALKGKYGYMSPEQLRFKRLDGRADLFALGVVLWEMLAGRRLYREKSLEDAARRILEEPPPEIEEERADVPPEVEQLLLSLLAKDREARPASAAAVVEALDLALQVVEADEGTFTLAAFLGERFGALRDEMTKDRALAVEVARAKGPSPQRPRASRRSDHPERTQAVKRTSFIPPRASQTRRGLTRLALVVFGSAILGAAMLLGAQLLTESPEDVRPGDVQNEISVETASAEQEEESATPEPPGPEPTEPGSDRGADVAAPTAVTEEPADDVPGSPLADEAHGASPQADETLTNGPTEARPRMRRRPRMRPSAMTGMMSSVDEWWTD
ncbi:MAG: hypothetical protein DRJ42_16460 [Deltaproteobacteria bacterium]|nr:MAG: hypothetical protein DRJ42_16460 [Deltaproteobacteria bacterium]